MIVERVEETSPDPIRLGGIAKFVAAEIEKNTSLESRAIVLGHIQRGGTPTPRDRVLSTQFGFHAFELLQRQNFGRVVVEQQGKITSVPILEVAGKVRTVNPEHITVRAALSLGTSFGI